MTRTSFFDEAQSDVAQLHLARSEAQFATLAELMIDRWIESGEVAVARTFKAEYLTPPTTIGVSRLLVFLVLYQTTILWSLGIEI